MSEKRKTTVVSAMALAFMWPFFRANYFEAFILTEDKSWVDAIGLYAIFFFISATLCLANLAVFRASSGEGGLLDMAVASGKRSIPIALGVGGSVGCGLMLVEGDYGLLPDVGSVVGVVLWALSFVVLAGLWTSFLRRLEKRQILVVMSVSFALSFAYSFVANLLGPTLEAVLLSLCCALSAIGLALCPGSDCPEGDCPVDASCKKRMGAVLAFLAIALVTSGVANGFLFADETLGFPFSDRFSYSLSLIIVGVALWFTFSRAKDLAKVVGLVVISSVAVLFMGFVMMLTLPDALMGVAQAGVVDAKAVLNFLLWAAVVFIVKFDPKRKVDVFAFFIAIQLLIGIVGYCAVSSLVLLGIAGKRFVLSVASLLLVVASGFFVYCETIKTRPTAISLEGRREEGEIASSVSLAEQYGLTAKESEVLELYGRGMTQRGIAEALVVSENTVKAHLSSIRRKTGCHKKDELIRLVAGEEMRRLKG